MRNKKKSMTIIALCKNKQGKLMMAGDRRSTWDYSFSQSMDVPKINKKDGVLLGATGSGDLCSIFVDDGGFNIPDKKIQCINTYMYNIFKPAVFKFLVNHHLGNKEEVKLPPGDGVEVVIGIEGTAWHLSIDNPMDAIMAGSVSLEPVGLPYTAGCGRESAMGILKYEKRRAGHITKQALKEALEVVADISRGCDDQIDIIIGD